MKIYFIFVLISTLLACLCCYYIGDIEITKRQMVLIGLAYIFMLPLAQFVYYFLEALLKTFKKDE